MYPRGSTYHPLGTDDPCLPAAVPNVPCTARENDGLGAFSGFPDSYTGASDLLILSRLTGAVGADVCWVITIPGKPVCFLGGGGGGISGLLFRLPERLPSIPFSIKDHHVALRYNPGL